MNLAVKDIRHSMGRFALTAVGLGMLMMVVMGMGGIYRGIIADATLLVESMQADLWIVQKNTKGPFAEISRIPTNLVYRAAAIPGVSDAREFVYHTVQREHQGKSLRMSVLGLSWPTDRGEWLPLIAGRALGQNHFEMVADKTLGLDLGERVRLGKDFYTVVGISTGMFSASGDGIGFFTVSDAQKIQFDIPGEAVRLEREARRRRGELSELGAGQPSIVEHAYKPPTELPAIAKPQVSAVLLRVHPGIDPDKIAKVISGWSDVTAYTQFQQMDLLLKGNVQRVKKQIGLFRILLTLIAGVIMSLILYTLTLDKIHSIALLKLIGAPNRMILGLILQQALIMGVIAFIIAYLIGGVVFPNFPRRVILLNSDLIQLGGIMFGISILASFLGIWKALSVDANEALS